MTVGAKRLVEESLFFVSLFSRTRQEIGHAQIEVWQPHVI